jgi:hypothetical protein
MFIKSTSVVLALSAQIHAASTPLRVQSEFESVFGGLKVPVVLGVRSKDTDTLVCQSVFDQVLKKVANKVEISFAYVAEYVDIIGSTIHIAHTCISESINPTLTLVSSAKTAPPNVLPTFNNCVLENTPNLIPSGGSSSCARTIMVVTG